MYTTVIYIIFERGISFLIILKLFEFSGFQTKMVEHTCNKSCHKTNLTEIDTGIFQLRKDR